MLLINNMLYHILLTLANKIDYVISVNIIDYTVSCIINNDYQYI